MTNKFSKRRKGEIGPAEQRILDLAARYRGQHWSDFQDVAFPVVAE